MSATRLWIRKSCAFQRGNGLLHYIVPITSWSCYAGRRWMTHEHWCLAKVGSTTRRGRQEISEWDDGSVWDILSLRCKGGHQRLGAGWVTLQFTTYRTSRDKQRAFSFFFFGRLRNTSYGMDFTSYYNPVYSGGHVQSIRKWQRIINTPQKPIATRRISTQSDTSWSGF